MDEAATITAEPPQPAAPNATARAADDRHAAAPLAGAVRVVSGLTLVSRFAGLARDVITARMFGAGLLGSAFQAAYAFPNFFRRLFGEGALSAAFLPEYTLLRRDDPARASALASITLWSLMLVTGGLTLVIELILLALLLLTPADPERALSFRLMMLMLPMMPAVCATAILGGILQAHGRFGPPAAAPIILNLFQIAAGAGFFWGWYAANPAAYIVGSAAVLASIVQILWSLHALRGKVAWTRAWHTAEESSRRVLKRFIPAMLGLGTIQLNSLMDLLFAMWPVWVGPTAFGLAVTLDDKSNAVLRYSQTIYQFPLGVFGIAVATAVFPLLSRSSDNNTDFVQHLRRGLRLSLFIGLPATVGLFLIRQNILTVIYGGGRHGFSHDDITRAAAVLAGFAPAIWAYSLNHVLTRAFYAKGDTLTPMRLAMLAVAFNFALNCTLIWWLREAGLAWSTAISAIIQCVILATLCSRKLAVRPFDRATTAAFARIAITTAIMGAAVWVVERGTRIPPGHETWPKHLLRLCMLVGTGGIIYAAFAAFLKLPELRWLTQRAPKGDTTAMSFE
ncbi:MAG TPA: murein biosynthesis integral membrane protein MurJ [Phycisphaerales bacterium]|nr:murein biosynthesis integral membrane protein MurJ [Phycisphaerales bacterium]